MGQVEVYNWLKKMRCSGDESFFYPKEIMKGLKLEGFGDGVVYQTRGDCFRLWQSGNGCLEMHDYDLKGSTNWLKAFRIKKKYCKVIKVGC